MFCSNCGTKLEEGTKFCTQCGTRLDGDADVSPAVKTAYAGTASKKNGWQYFCGVFKKYAVFKGRARRAEYWWFNLFFTIFSWGSMFIAFIAGFIEGALDLFPDREDSVLGSIVSLVFSLVFLLPLWGVAVRRMHDVNKRGWFLLIPIYSLVLLCTAGTAGPNRFGPDPKQEG
ncbi:MAG: DUF805 domain-containing protein [Treponematales bacterium]